MPHLDPHRCPICGAANQCEVAHGSGACWCFSREIPNDVLEKVPAEAFQLACVCKGCAFGDRDPASVMARMQDILRGRG